MKTPRLLPLLALAAAFLASSVATHANHHKEDGFVPLFDGKTLNGWHTVGGTGEFKAENNLIVGFGENVKGNTFLRTDRTYQDFDFRGSFKREDGNSGIMYRAAQKPGENGRVFGYQYEHGNKPERAWTGGLYDEARRKWLQPHSTDPRGQAAFTAQGQRLMQWGEWNDVRIHCEGNVTKLWLNGELRVHFVDTDPDHNTLAGFFGLQVHSGTKSLVSWKNLRIKELNQ
jgi:hypothetical protein